MDKWDYFNSNYDEYVNKKLKDLEASTIRDQTSLLKWYVEEFNLQPHEIRTEFIRIIGDNLFKLGLGVGVYEGTTK